jgi:hypothetical protein
MMCGKEKVFHDVSAGARVLPLLRLLEVLADRLSAAAQSSHRRMVAKLNWDTANFQIGSPGEVRTATRRFLESDRKAAKSTVIPG